MPEKKLDPIDQLMEEWGKLVGRILTSEDFRSRGPGFEGNILSDNTLNRDVTQDGIRIFVNGEGDLNPLFRNPEYAKKTKYKTLIAPPNYLYTICYAQSPPDHGPVIAGVDGMYSGCDREWFRPVCVGDTFTYRVMCPAENKVMPSKYAGRKVLSYEKADYYRQGGELVAGYSSYEQWLDMKKAEELNIFGKTDLAKMPEYTEQELKEIYAAQDREEIRGAKPRYWEDVKMGDELTPVVRGPVNDAELTAWHAAGHAHFISERLTRMMWEKMPASPGWKGVNKWEFGQGFLKGQNESEVPDGKISAAHPRRVVVGQQTEAWRYIMLTNWMGDDGFLWKFSAQIRKMNMIGDTTWSKGKVINKYCDNGKYCVDIELQSVNQTGSVTVTGKATIILPSRDHGPVIYPEPYARVPFKV
jgi:acyl dehydratase